MKKKIMPLLLAVLLLLGNIVACNEEEKPKVVASYIGTNEHGAPTLYVDGQPFLYTAVEMRSEAYFNCGDISDLEDYESYFQAASELGVNVVTCSLDWRDIEPRKDEYDFSHIRTLLGYAYQYGLKLEILWYSTCMCAYSQEYQLPDYIVKDAETYPRYKFSNGTTYSEKQAIYYGKQYLFDFDDKDLMKRESLVIENLMDYIYNWEEAYGFPKTLIGVQVYNEVDLLLDENRQESYGFKFADAGVTKEKIWSELLTGINNAGKAFKESDYVVYTRTNFTSIKSGDYDGRTESQRFKEMYALEYIDSVGMDPYVYEPSALTSLIRSSQAIMQGNFTHIAENGGEYSNTDALTLLALSQNCGYTVYELARAKGFPDMNNNQGILDVNLQDRYESSTGNYTSYTTDNYTDRARSVFKALKQIDGAVTGAKTEDFAVFNVLSATARENYSQTICTSNVSVDFSTNASAVGFAIEYKGELFVFATKPATINFTLATLTQAKIATTNADGETVWSETNAWNGESLSLDGGRIYRLTIEQGGKLLSTANQFKGY